MNLTHTPAPWRMITTHRGVWHISSNHGLIARCDTNKPAAENEGNANLIAAAPDLLELIKKVLSETAGDEPLTPYLLCELQDAVDKAEGGAP